MKKSISILIIMTILIASKSLAIEHNKIIDIILIYLFFNIISPSYKIISLFINNFTNKHM